MFSTRFENPTLAREMQPQPYQYRQIHIRAYVRRDHDTTTHIKPIFLRPNASHAHRDTNSPRSLSKTTRLLSEILLKMQDSQISRLQTQLQQLVQYLYATPPLSMHRREITTTTSLRLPASLDLRPDSKRIHNIQARHAEHINRDKHPEHVEEHQIEPQIHPVARVEIRVASQPLWAKGQKAAVQLHGRDNDDEDACPRVALGEAVADEAGEGPGEKDGEELKRDDCLCGGVLVD